MTPRVLLPLLAALLVASCAPQPRTETSFALGTVCTVTLYGNGSTSAALFRKLFARLEEIEATLSANRADSELEAVNAAAGRSPVEVSETLAAVLSRALYFAEISGGAFNPAIGPLVKLWRIGEAPPGEARVPESEEIRAACELCRWHRIVLSGQTVFLPQEGMRLDLGAIAKGYAAAELAALIQEAGEERAIIDLGGNILVLGAKKEARKSLFSERKSTPWKVAVQDPLSPRGTALGIITVTSSAIVTSGVYERFFEFEGKRYHHILSAETGLPVENGLLSVTVITPASASIDADALSTTLFALGWEKGTALLASFPDSGAVFVFSDKTILLTPSLKERFTLTSAAYTPR